MYPAQAAMQSSAGMTGQPAGMPTKEKCDQRLIIYGGPGKTGSSTIQNFYSLRGCSDRPTNKLQAFQNWTMPKSYYANLCMHMQTPSGRLSIKKSAEKDGLALQKQQASKSSRENVFLACEYTASLFQTGEYTSLFLPRGKESEDSIFDVMDFIGYGCPEFVFHYRAPRASHWLSTWNQATKRQSSFGIFNHTVKEYVCSDNSSFAFRYYTLGFVDPLRAVSDFRKPHFHPADTDYRHPSDWPVTLVDMAGVAKAGRDILHTTACDILGIPCTDDWRIKGVTPAMSKRANEGERKEHDLTVEQVSAIETIFRRRDCLYRDELENDEKVTILYRDSLWNDCPKDIPEFYRKYLNGDHMLANIRSIVGCPGSLSFNFTTMRVGEGVDASGIPIEQAVKIAQAKSFQIYLERRQRQNQAKKEKEAKAQSSQKNVPRIQAQQRMGTESLTAQPVETASRKSNTHLPIVRTLSPYNRTLASNNNPMSNESNVSIVRLEPKEHPQAYGYNERDVLNLALMGEFERRLQIAIFILLILVGLPTFLFRRKLPGKMHSSNN